MQTINGWFDFASYYDEIVNRFAKLTGPIRILEIGVFEGASSCYLAQRIRDAGLQAELHCCDVFRVHDQYQFAGLLDGNSTRYIFEGHLAERGLTDLVTIQEGRSEEILSRFPDYHFDFVFVDGSHHYRDIVRDIELAMKKLKPNGILAGHDIDLPDVRQALNKYGLRYQRHGNVWEVTSKIGIVYVAWGQHGINEASRAAWWGKLPTCLITDLESTVPDKIFGQVIRTDFAAYKGLHHFYRKMEALQKSPFDITLYSDADTYPIGDLSLGFAKASRHQFAVVIAPGQTFLWRDIEHIHFNCGVLFFQGHPTEWPEQVLSHASTFTDSDEPAWSISWDELGINPAVLPSVFNLVSAGRIHDRPIRIWHSRHPLQTHLVSEFDEVFSRTR